MEGRHAAINSQSYISDIFLIPVALKILINMSLRQEYSYLLFAKIENNRNHLCLIHNFLVAIKLLLINPCAQDYSVN